VGAFSTRYALFLVRRKIEIWHGRNIKGQFFFSVTGKSMFFFLKQGLSWSWHNWYGTSRVKF
jgi:hypothetical protein